MRPRAGRDQSLAKAKHLTIDRQCVARDEAGFAEVNVHASRGQSPRGIVATQARADAAHPLHRGREIDTHLVRNGCTKALRVAHVGIKARGADQRFRRHAADIQIDSANRVALDQRDLDAERSRQFRRGKACRAGTDNRQLVGTTRLRIAPGGRTRIGNAFALKCVWRYVCGNVVAR
jgi:hypothetical protein